MTERRHKKYRPRHVRIPALVLDTIPIPTKARQEISLDAHVALQALKDGEINLSYYACVSFYMGVGARLAAHCNDAEMLFLLFSLGEVAAREVRKGRMQRQLFEVLETAMSVIDDILDKNVCKRSEWGEASLGSCYGKQSNPDAGRLVLPDEPGTWRDILGEPAGVWIHQRASRGRLEYVEETKRLLWVDPNEDFMVWLQEPLVLILEEPKKMEESAWKWTNPCPKKSG